MSVETAGPWPPARSPREDLGPGRPTWLLARGVQIALDAAGFTAMLALAFLLRFDFDVALLQGQHLGIVLPVVVSLQVLSYAAWGVYRFLWRYVALRDAFVFAGAAATSAGLLLLVRLGPFQALPQLHLPAAVIVTDGVLGLVATLGGRMALRLFVEKRERRPASGGGRPGPRAERALLVGAGRAGVLVSREIVGRGDHGLDVLGFVDDDRTKLGSVVNGIPVVGTTGDIPALVKTLGLETVIITIARATRSEIRQIVERCESSGVRVRTVPGMRELLAGRVRVSDLRDVDLAGLLGREAIRLEDGPIRRFLFGRRVLVTGAGGSIGSELVRQVARFEPARLILLERSEFALYQIDEEVRRSFPSLSVVSVLADVRDSEHMGDLFGRLKPEVVIHAAAHKHVPIAEENVRETVANNVFGTLSLAEVSGRHGARSFVLVSTDKAVNPSSVMGATKRAAELAIRMLEDVHPTQFVTVRFGNVLDSTGSVVPRFRDQIRRGGPVTVTHPDMRRYFMTIPEAAQLVLQAASLGSGGEIFVLDMGEPVRIVDLATNLIRLSGLRPHEDIEIVFTGIRPGEKLFEELSTSQEKAERTPHGRVFVGRVADVPRDHVAASLARLSALCDGSDDDAIRHALGVLIPEASLSAEHPAGQEGRPERPREDGSGIPGSPGLGPQRREATAQTESGYQNDSST